MCLLLETIRYFNGEFDNLNMHSERMNLSRTEMFGTHVGSLSLNDALRKFVSDKVFNRNTVYKCRVIYGKKIENIEFSPYKKPVIKTLKTVYNNNIDYHLKYLNRSPIERLKTLKGTFDDIVIVKDGLITDTSFSNLLFFNGKEWLTPHTPLLKGTRRRQLLENEIVTTAEIRPADLKYFKKIRLINAMIRFEDEVDIDEIKTDDKTLWKQEKL